MNLLSESPVSKVVVVSRPYSILVFAGHRAGFVMEFAEMVPKPAFLEKDACTFRAPE